MKVVNTGTTYRIYADDLITSDMLPCKFYKVEFFPMSGWCLEETDEISVNEKIYGQLKDKRSKVIKSFKRSIKNFGVILSGDKGMGKSLFVKFLAEKIVEEYPVIIVDKYIDGIADFINSINQECMVIFDEFDKVFRTKEDSVGTSMDPQTEMLGLFDGIVSSKKLFVITCNDINKLSDYFINRPGRFHYHFRFNYPAIDEIKEYLNDNLNSSYLNEVDNIISFASKAKLNYDCLRSIVSELNQGYSFKDSINDLNIVRIDEYVYNWYIRFTDGTIVKNDSKFYGDLFGTEEQELSFFLENSRSNYTHQAIIKCTPSDSQYDLRTRMHYINASDISFEWTWNMDWNDPDQQDKDLDEKIKLLKLKEVECILFKRVNNKDSLRYIL